MGNASLVKHLVDSEALTTNRIIRAFMEVDRKDFIPSEMGRYSYNDEPLPIGYGQTISQPTTVALMTEALQPEEGDKILEIGTGSGYQSAILSRIVGKKGIIITIERKPELYEYAKQRLSSYGNVRMILGDGSIGFAKDSPYDRIIVTAASPTIPEPLKEQLKAGGKMIIPVGGIVQRLILVSKKRKGFDEKDIGGFMFVPLIGKHGFNEKM